MTEDVHALARELESAASRLRAGDVRGEEAAELVELCADLAGRVSAALEARARAPGTELPVDEMPEQERLL